MKRQVIFRSRNEAKTKPLTKREFCQQYLMARASTNISGLDAIDALREGFNAWELLEKECGKP